MNKMLKSIASLVDGSPNYGNIENKLNFSSCTNEDIYQSKKRKALKIAFPISFVGVVLALTAILIPTILNAQRNNQKDSPFALINGSIRVLKKYYVNNSWQELDATTESVETNEYYIKNKEVTKVNTWEGFKKRYGSNFAIINDFTGSDFNEIINESTFIDNCLLGLQFTGSCTEFERSYDGRGVVIENIQATNGDLFVKFSVPTKGFDEGISMGTFFAIASKDDIADNFEFTYEVMQRNTGEKGSTYYPPVYHSKS